MSLVYTKTLTDNEVKILKHDLVDITDWINKAIEGKINNCTKRASREYVELAEKENLTTVPTQMLDKAIALFNHTTYLNRAKRDALDNPKLHQKTRNKNIKQEK